MMLLKAKKKGKGGYRCEKGLLKSKELKAIIFHGFSKYTISDHL